MQNRCKKKQNKYAKNSDLTYKICKKKNAKICKNMHNMQRISKKMQKIRLYMQNMQNKYAKNIQNTAPTQEKHSEVFRKEPTRSTP